MSYDVFISHCTEDRAVAEAACAAGERDADKLRLIAREPIEAQPLASIDYLSLADEATLQELHGRIEAPALLSLMVAFGDTHLIDNTTLVPREV